MPRNARTQRDSGNQGRKESRRDKRSARFQHPPQEHIREPTPVCKKTATVIPASATQAAYATSIDTNDLAFGLGPAGTGKTYLAAAKAAIAFRDGTATKLILSRPAMEAGENLGFLPGTLDEKYAPYLRPYMEALTAILGTDWLEYAIKRKMIEPIPLAYMRGMTMQEGWWVLLDEAQNTTKTQMKMFLTRMGKGSKMLINGDTDQVDLPNAVDSGLADAVNRLQGLDKVGFTTFTDDDCVRHDIVYHVLKRYAYAPMALRLDN